MIAALSCGFLASFIRRSNSNVVRGAVGSSFGKSGVGVRALSSVRCLGSPCTDCSVACELSRSWRFARNDMKSFALRALSTATGLVDCETAAAAGVFVIVASCFVAVVVGGGGGGNGPVEGVSFRVDTAARVSGFVGWPAGRSFAPDTAESKVALLSSLSPRVCRFVGLSVFGAGLGDCVVPGVDGFRDCLS